MTPPPAGESHGAADQGGDVPSPPEGNEQQAGAASLKVTKDQRHWTGQMVKRKSNKRVGEVVDIEGESTLLVAFESGRNGERNLHGLASHEVDVLPDQPAPDGVLRPTPIENTAEAA